MAEALDGLKRSQRCATVTKEQIGEELTLMGWVNKKRNLGSLIFVDLRDRTGLVQIIFDSDHVSAELFEKAETLRNEFVIAVTGKLRKRAGAVNKELATGELELLADSLKILAESEVTPFQIFGDTGTKEELRLKYRYLDLRKPELQKKLILRNKVVNASRNFMQNEGFLEIETPILINSTPEGARDYLVPSRIHRGCFYALPQSPQLYKQLLMCSGFDRYFQVARCFRDEDLRADRQPEFTQMDMELSFVDMEDVLELNERLLKHIFAEIGVDVKLPIRRMPYKEAMERFGSDKPDLRFGMELCDISDAVKDCEFKVFSEPVSKGGSVRGIVAKGQAGMSRKKIDALVDMAKGYGAKGLAYLAYIDEGEYKSSFAKFMTEDELKAIIKAMNAEKGDLMIIASGEDNEFVMTLLGALRLELAEKLDLIDNDKWEFLWVTDFPLLEWSEEENRFVAKHHPFTAPFDEDIQYLDSDPGRVRAKAYDIVLNGNEIGGGSVRIHRSDVQSKMFEVLGFTKEEAEKRFGYLLEAFKYGVPPHAGLAYGLDRLIMLMTKADSIREVIAFPKVKDASCMMTKAPGTVSEEQLKELGLIIAPEEEKEK